LDTADGALAFYRLDLDRLTSRLQPMAFAFAFGATISLTLPFVNVELQPFVYFQF